MRKVYDFSQFIKEDLEYHKNLNPAFWSSEDEFDPETRKKLLQISDDFYDDLKVDAPIVDVYLIGSMVNYSWSQYSDLDVHVVLDFSKIDKNVELVADALNGKKFMWNLRHPVVIKGYDVELYVQDVNHKHISAGTYSLMKGEWLTKPKWDPPNVDMEYVEEKVRLYEREIVEVDKMMDERPDPDDAKHILERVKLLKKKITKARDASLQKDGEFSIENLVFKELRHTGWIKKLIDLGAKAYSAIYSDRPVNVGDENELTERSSKVKQFGQFVTEVLSYDDATRDRIASELSDLNMILDLGLISKEVAASKKLKIIKDSGDPEAFVADPILGPIVSSGIFAALKSETWKKLQEMGYVFRSNYKQVINGTFVMTTNKAMSVEREPVFRAFGGPAWVTQTEPVSLAIYSSSLAIHRLNKGDRPQKLFEYPDLNLDPNLFYEYAFNWIINKIDENDADLSSRSRTKPGKTNEVINYDEDTKQRLATELSELQALLDLNLIPLAKFNAKRSEILRKSGDHEALVNDPVLGPVIASDVFKALRTEEWNELQSLGYKCISTYRQIMNGTIEMTTDLAINTMDKYRKQREIEYPLLDFSNLKARSIGIFSTGYVRQMNVGQNPIIAKYDFGGLEMYKAAMNLIRDKIESTDGYLNTKSSLARERKKDAKGDVFLPKLIKKYDHFDLLPEEIEKFIVPNLTKIFRPPNNSSDMNEIVRNVIRGLKLGYLTLYGRAYVGQLMTPELEQLITEREIHWTNVTRISSWAARSPAWRDGGTMSTTFMFLDNPHDTANDTAGCTFSAMKYYYPTQVNDLSGNCANRMIEVYLPSIVEVPPYCLDGFKRLDPHEIEVEYHKIPRR